MTRLSALAFACALPGLALAGAAGQADFLIVTSPQAYTIYNQYETPVSEAEVATLLPGAPLQVVQARGTLGDGISSAMQCLYRGRSWYLLLDTLGKPMLARGAESSGNLLRGCTVLGDTVELTAPGVRLSPQQGGAVALAKGERLLLVLRQGSGVYALRLGSKPLYGMCAASSSASWRRLAHAVVAAPDVGGLAADIAVLLAGRVERANDAYRLYFDRFNRATGQQLSAPQWRRESGSDLAWRLVGPRQYAQQLEQSSGRLAQELGALLTGKPQVVVHEAGRIEVKAMASGE